MKFEFINLLDGTHRMEDFDLPNEISKVNMHTSLYALFLISEGEVFDLARKKLDELGVNQTAEVIGEKWPADKYTPELIKDYADLLLSA